MIYIYRRGPSASARQLVGALRSLGLKSRRLRGFQDPHYNSKAVLVMWGDSPPVWVHQGRVLNWHARWNKLEELRMLKAGGVLVPPFTQDNPNTEGWVGRTLWHSQGEDFSTELANPEYWTKQLEFLREFRIHVFDGLSIRTGLKVPRDSHAHPWVRSHRHGWIFDYGSQCQHYIRQTHRDLAKKALTVLGLTFGAVDLGVLRNGSPLVLEVNSAPGFGNRYTLGKYAEKIKEWYQE